MSELREAIAQELNKARCLEGRTVGNLDLADRIMERMAQVAPPIGQRYRNEAGEVTAVVVPAEATPDMCDQLTLSQVHMAVKKWRNALDTLSEPSNEVLDE